ncbi:hypothetical protein HJC23_005755 [Cyclotella cryptica]|uniref:Orc1-like AAA ATPase domain-containing protein n=1 Tax=Cyclotella cryptica TaxID=29204 RepID=A0ABD3QE23_9STRA
MAGKPSSAPSRYLNIPMIEETKALSNEKLSLCQGAQVDSTEELPTKAVAINTGDRREHLKKQISLRSSGGCRLFGRASEESVLLNSYYASLTLSQNSPANLILICGGSGLGKTKLAETLRVYAVEDDGFFIRGKFDQSSYGAASLPYSGIDHAFREYCSQLKKRTDDRNRVVKALKKEFQKDEGSLLCEAIPSLRDLIEDSRYEVSFHHSESSDDPTSTKNRFHMLSYLVKKFIRVISSLGDPIIFLLDDMQWSDASTLDLVKVLACGAKNPFLFIFTYRPVASDHPFLQLIKSLYNSNNVAQITLHCLGSDDVNEMVCSILGEHISGNSCSLSDFIFRITHGNPLLVRQQVIYLLDNGLIWFESERLVWDMAKIEESNAVSSSLTTIFCSKINTLPEACKKVLMICACIGCKIDYKVLGILVREMCLDYDLRDNGETDAVAVGKSASLRAIQDGLFTESHDGSGVSFFHDSIQSAAYSLLKSEEQAPFHMNLGRILNAQLTPSSKYLFTVANQFARGCELVDEKERMEVVHVFLRAADESKSAAAIRGAHYFYAKAISILSSLDWEDHFRLCCDAYLNGSEVAIWAGADQDAVEWLDVVHWRTRGSVMDQLRASWIKFNVLVTKGELETAVSLGIKDLGSLAGVKIKLKNLRRQNLFAMVRVRRLMRNQNETTLLEYPRMTNEKMNATLRYLNQVALVCAAMQSRVLPLVCVKIIEMNMKYGISSTMPTAIGWYGTIMIRAGLPLSEAATYSRIALRLQDALKCTETRAQVAALCYGIIHVAANGFPDLSKLYEGYTCGLRSGDIRHAMLCAHYLGSLPFHYGKNLAYVAATLETYSRSMMEYNTIKLLGINKVYQEVVVKLTGCMVSSRDRAVLKGVGLTCNKVPFEREHAVTLQILLAYILDDYDLAWESTSDLHKIIPQTNLMFVVVPFFHGMTALALLAQGKESRKRNLKKVIESSRKMLNKERKESSSNAGHYQHLIEAEYATFNKKFDLAERHFSLSIEQASNSGVTHIHALSWERFGYYYLIRDDQDSAYEKLRMAHRIYAKWGKIHPL